MHPGKMFSIKAILLGNSGVGKSCLAMRYCDNHFSDNMLTTIGIDFRIKSMVVDGVPCKFELWDTAGQERFHTITTSYLRCIHTIMLVYDCTDRSSFDGVCFWASEIEKHASTPRAWSSHGGVFEKPLIFLVRNKIDL
eukprot:c12914_g1_i1.p1 GENE.c12914_g1_i1~~c12914_g1_i1.p1  ORF type:complete len:138 (+),score=29.88 c12914_g1_i1:95-508(+)